MSKRKTSPTLPSMDELLSEEQPSALPQETEETKQQQEKERGKRRAKYQARYDLPPGMKDKVVSVEELQLYLKNTVPNEADQSPQLVPLRGALGQFVFYPEGAF